MRPAGTLRPGEQSPDLPGLAKEIDVDNLHCQPVVDFFMDRSDLTAYILAGGSSRRMGTDKLFLQIGGRSMLERIIATCEGCFKEVKLVAGQEAKFSAFDYPVVLDNPIANGPMGGVIAALEDCEDECCFVTAADLCDLSGEVVDSLVRKYNNQQYLGMREAGGMQPLCGIYHKSALEVFYRFAQNKEFSVTEAVMAMNHEGMVLPSGLWRNINTPNDLVIGDINA
jgi:molybdopterin-guanine dinucleotide biosynthesis protein A